MTVPPGKGDPNKDTPGATKAGQPEASPRTAAPRREETRDLIPPWLLIGIFAVVMFVTWFLLKENWVTEWTRYRSIKMQHTGQWDKAAEYLHKLQEAGAEADDPLAEFSPTYLSELGYAYFRMGKYDESLKWYNLAQQYRTNFPSDDQGNAPPPVDFRNMIGLVYYKMGNLDQAEKNLLGALETNRVDAIANFTMGQIAMDRGNYIKAADYFKVVSDNPAYEDEVKKYYAEIEQKLFAGIS